MSGIAGIVHLGGAPVGATHLAAMLEAMADRGPDGSGQQVLGSVGLGHCLFSTTPESVGEQQPVGDEESGCWLVGDLRIDNREELLDALEQARVPLRVGTDAELVLRAYGIWGEALPPKLLGDFAFALWDARQKRLFCARDPLGVKPFYYYWDSRRFLFASEIKALFAYPGLRRRPNEVMMGLYLADDYSDREQTLYANVFRLPGAHRLTVEGGGRQQDRYWDVCLEKPIRYRRDEDYAQHFREIFSRAVEARLRSSEPVGAFLSGGLDSGSVVSMAQQLYEKRGENKALETFSAYFLTPRCDERNYIEEMARRWPIRTHYYQLDNVGPSTYAEEMTERFEGIHDATLFSFRALAEKARERGVRVILTGVGGDDFYSGSLYVFADLLRQGRLRDVHRQINLLAQTYLLDRRPLWLYYTLYPLLPNPMKSVLRRVRRRLRRRYPSWMAPGFAERIHLVERLGADRRDPPQASHAQRHFYHTLHGGYWAYIVEVINTLAGTQQVEFRCPFADARLVDFALRIPGEQFERDDLSKWLVRSALEGLLPEPIRLRKRKTELDPVIEYEIRERPLVPSLLSSLELAADGFVDAHEVRKLYSEVREGGMKLGLRLYSIVAVELWYRKHRESWSGG